MRMLVAFGAYLGGAGMLTQLVDKGRYKYECVPWVDRVQGQCIHVVCMMDGAERPTIIRLFKDYSVIVASSANVEIPARAIPASPARDFLLVWDWKITYASENSAAPKPLIKSQNLEILLRVRHPRDWNRQGCTGPQVRCDGADPRGYSKVSVTFLGRPDSRFHRLF